MQDTLEIDLILPGEGEVDSTLFVSNFHWWPRSEIVEYIERVKGQKGWA